MIILYIWLFFGLINAIGILLSYWFVKNEITLGVIGFALCMFCFGIIGFIGWLISLIIDHGDIVIFKRKVK